MVYGKYSRSGGVKKKHETVWNISLGHLPPPCGWCFQLKNKKEKPIPSGNIPKRLGLSENLGEYHGIPQILMVPPDFFLMFKHVLYKSVIFEVEKAHVSAPSFFSTLPQASSGVRRHRPQEEFWAHPTYSPGYCWSQGRVYQWWAFFPDIAGFFCWKAQFNGIYMDKNVGISWEHWL